MTDERDEQEEMDSLNASVAAGVLMYAVMRSR